MKNKKGFTLIELLVVIAIIGLLSTLAVVSLNTAREKAADARKMSDIKQMSTAFELYYTEKSGYPGYSDGVSVCNDNGVVTGVDTLTLQLMCCGPAAAIVDDAPTPNVYLNAIPCEPGETTGYIYEGNVGSSVGNADSYCIQATLSSAAATTYFVCSNGSCFGTDAVCGDIL